MTTAKKPSLYLVCPARVSSNSDYDLEFMLVKVDWTFLTNTDGYRHLLEEMKKNGLDPHKIEGYNVNIGFYDPRRANGRTLSDEKNHLVFWDDIVKKDWDSAMAEIADDSQENTGSTCSLQDLVSSTDAPDSIQLLAVSARGVTFRTYFKGTALSVGTDIYPFSKMRELRILLETRDKEAKNKD